MVAAPLHPDEIRRLAALERLGILDTPAEERFDRITRIAAAVLDVPMSLVTVIAEDRQWFKSKVGIDGAETRLEDSFCAHAIVQPDDDLMVVEDATLDDRFADNPMVAGDDRIRFYAGHVVREPTGMPIGALCVVDRKPRELDERSRRVLADLAAMVEEELARGMHRDLLAELADSEHRKSMIVESLNEGLVLQDGAGRVTEWNDAALTLLGLTADELAGRTSFDPRWGAVREDGSPMEGAEHPAVQARETGEPVVNRTMGVRRPDGTLVWLQANAQPVIDDRGQIDGVVVAFEDVTARRELQQALERSARVARTSLDALEQGVVLIDAQANVVRCNPAVERILGYTGEELGERWRERDLLAFDEYGAQIPHDRHPLRLVMQGETVQGQVVTFTRKDGREILLRLSLSPDADGEGGAVIGFADITEQHRALRDNERFAHIFRHANDIITVLDRDGAVLYASPSNERILGYPDGYRHPDGILGLVHPDDLERTAVELEALVADRRGSDPFTVHIQAYGGEWRTMECVGVNLLDEPSVRGVVITARDTTERERLAEQLAHRATHDPLTDLATRRLLDERLGEALSRAIRDDRRVGLCFLDLDGFKAVNDTLGHAAGDQLLVDVADRIRQVVRGGDTAARLGGDEFVVVLDPVGGEQEALVAATRIRDRVVEMAADLPVEIGFGTSVGVALSDIDDTPTTLLSRADAALYRAKSRRDSSIEIAPSELLEPWRSAAADG